MPTEQVPDQQRELPYPDEPPRTHWDGCWKAPRHHNCAAVRVYALLDALDRERAMNQKLREAAEHWLSARDNALLCYDYSEEEGCHQMYGEAEEELARVVRALLHPESTGQEDEG